jgi:hypothetical protein
MPDDGVRPGLDQLRAWRRVRERRETRAQRPPGQEEHEPTRRDEQDREHLQWPARRIRPARREETEHENRREEKELDRDPAAAASAEPRKLNQAR